MSNLRRAACGPRSRGLDAQALRPAQEVPGGVARETRRWVFFIAHATLPRGASSLRGGCDLRPESRGQVSKDRMNPNTDIVVFDRFSLQVHLFWQRLGCAMKANHEPVVVENGRSGRTRQRVGQVAEFVAVFDADAIIPTNCDLLHVP